MASIMRFEQWQTPSGVGSVKLDSAGRLYSPGSTVQTLQTVDTAVTTISSASNEAFIAYNNLNTIVTPKFANSKFLISFQINVGGNGGTSYRAALNVNGTTYGTTTSGSQRASSNSIYLSGGLPGDASIHSLTGQYLFQNTGSANVSVAFEIFKQTGSQVIYINRAYTYDDTARGRPASWVTIQEIAQ